MVPKFGGGWYRTPALLRRFRRSPEPRLHEIPVVVGSRPQVRADKERPQAGGGDALGTLPVPGHAAQPRGERIFVVAPLVDPLPVDSRHGLLSNPMHAKKPAPPRGSGPLQPLGESQCLFDSASMPHPQTLQKLDLSGVGHGVVFGAPPNVRCAGKPSGLLSKSVTRPECGPK